MVMKFCIIVFEVSFNCKVTFDAMRAHYVESWLNRKLTVSLTKLRIISWEAIITRRIRFVRWLKMYILLSHNNNLVNSRFWSTQTQVGRELNRYNILFIPVKIHSSFGNITICSYFRIEEKPICDIETRLEHDLIFMLTIFMRN